MGFFKGATLFFLGMSCIFFMARAFEIVPIANNTIQYIKSIFLTANGNNTSDVWIILDGGSTWGITITNLSNHVILGTDGSGKLQMTTSGDVYNFISGYVLSWPTWATWTNGTNGAIWATWSQWITWVQWTTWVQWMQGIQWVQGIQWIRWVTWAIGATGSSTYLYISCLLYTSDAADE